MRSYVYMFSPVYAFFRISFWGTGGNEAAWEGVPASLPIFDREKP